MAYRNVFVHGLAAAGFLLACQPVAFAAVALITADRDNTIYSESSNLSNGAGQQIFAGATGMFNPGNIRRALIRFDLAGRLPAGSTIHAVTLRLTLSQAPNFTPQSASLYRVTADWGEAGSNAGTPGGDGAPAQPGDATWGDRFHSMGLPWASAGGDLVASPSATAVVGSTVGAIYSWDSTPGMVADVVSWLNHPNENYGWILRIDNEAGPRTTRRFESRDNPNAALRPVLVVDYTAPPTGPGAVPDGNLRPGIPLMVDRSLAGTPALTWGESCRPADADFAVFVGTLAALAAGVYDHAPEACSTAGGQSYAFAVNRPEDLFFVVVPVGGGLEGSYGLDSAASERPAGFGTCFARPVGGPFCPTGLDLAFATK